MSGRAYNRSLPGPTLRLVPGDTLRLELVNKLRVPTNYRALSLKDTVPLPVRGKVVIRTRFTDFTCEYVYHCHILNHEDHGMMGTVRVGRRAAAIEGPGPSPAPWQ